VTARRAAALLAALAALALFAITVVWPSRHAPGYDLVPLAVAGRLLDTGRGEHLYAHDARHYNVTGSREHESAAREIGFAAAPTPYVYPPLVAAAMRPVSRLHFPAVMAVWTGLSLLFVLAAFWLVLDLYAPGARRPEVWAGLLAAATLFEPVRYGFWLGQTTSLIFLLTLVALALQRRGRPAGAGLALAVAAFVKLTPAAFALLWLWRGPRRAAAWCAGGLAALAALSVAVCGWPLHAEYLERVRAIGGTVLAAFNNHGLPAFVARFDLPPGAHADWTIYPLTTKTQLISAVLLAGFAAAAVRYLRRIPAEHEGRWRALAEAAVFVFVLLAPTIAWSHYFVALVPVLAALAGAGAHRQAGLAVAMAAALALLCRPLVPAQDVLRATGSQVIAAPTLAALLLAVVLLVVLRTCAASR
jgi:hypothetical protein